MQKFENFKSLSKPFFKSLKFWIFSFSQKNLHMTRQILEKIFCLYNLIISQNRQQWPQQWSRRNIIPSANTSCMEILGFQVSPQPWHCGICFGYSIWGLSKQRIHVSPKHGWKRQGRTGQQDLIWYWMARVWSTRLSWWQLDTSTALRRQFVLWGTKPWLWQPKGNHMCPE